MRETDFIARNQEKWADYEVLLRRGAPPPADLHEMYVQVTEDLAYATTFYRNRSVRVYLNGLARRIDLALYAGHRHRGNELLTFWTEELPLTLYHYRRQMLVATLLFLIAMGIGIVSYRMDPGFADTILGAGYVEMTEDNIARGDPMAVYRQQSPFRMSVAITLNNIFVALLTFLGGAFFGIGTVVYLVRTGIMLGVFQYFFLDRSPAAPVDLPEPLGYAAEAVSAVLTAGSPVLASTLAALVSVFSTGGVFRESLLTIWIHGALEISSIVIAGGAGLVMASGLLFPGPRPRWPSFLESARAGLKIMFGVLPLFVIAGFLEGYVTRQTGVPDGIRLVFILGCFAFIFWNYLVLPRRVAARLADGRSVPPPRSVAPREAEGITGRILPFGRLLGVSFALFRRQAPRVLLPIAALAAVYAWLFAQMTRRVGYPSLGVDLIDDAGNLHRLLWLKDAPLLFTLLLFGVQTVLFSFLFRTARSVITGSSAQRPLVADYGLLAVAAACAACFQLSGNFSLLLVVFVYPFLLMLGYAFGRGTQGKGGMVFRYVYGHLPESFVPQLVTLLLALPVMYLLDTVFGTLIFQALEWVIYAEGATIDRLNVGLQVFLYVLAFGLLFFLWCLQSGLAFETVHERNQAGGLRERMQEVGRGRQLRGMHAED